MPGRSEASVFFLVIGCSGSNIGYSGTKMSDFFPMDGDRSATFVWEGDPESADAVEYKLVQEKKTPVEQREGATVVTWEYTEDLEGNVLGAEKWSATPGDSVFVWAWQPRGAEEFISFDPPVAITSDDDSMRVGDSVTTDTTDSEGTSWTFTSTYVGQLSECGTLYADDWTDCANIVVEASGGGDVPSFVGDYELVTRYWIAHMTRTGDTAAWELGDYDYEKE
jgi:hypothetical protein